MVVGGYQIDDRFDACVEQFSGERDQRNTPA
jgi:hypothetical protein